MPSKTRVTGVQGLRTNRNEVKDLLVEQIDFAKKLSKSPFDSQGEFRKKEFRDTISLLKSHLKRFEQLHNDVKLLLRETSEEDDLDEDSILTLLNTEDEDGNSSVINLAMSLKDLLSDTLSDTLSEQKEKELEEFQQRLALEKLEKAHIEEMARIQTQAKAQAERDQLIVQSGGTLLGAQPAAPIPTEDRRMAAKPPKIVIPKFSGDRLKWVEFDSIFTSLIINGTGFSDIDKLHYLKSNIEGEAAKVIAGLEITGENFKAAYDLLKERYGDSQVIIETLFRSISNVKAPGSSLSDLRDFYDSIECSFRSLEARKVNVNNNFGFCVSIKDKLPYNVRLKLEERKDPTLPWDMALLRKHLKGYIHQLEIVSADNSQDKESEDIPQKKFEQKPPFHSYSGGHYRPKSSAQALFGTSGSKSKSDSNSDSSKSCLFCQDNRHLSTYCPAYISLDARISRLKALKKCTTCYGPTQKDHHCPFPLRCLHCGETGHQSPMCKKSIEERTKESSGLNVNSTSETGERVSAVGNTSNSGLKQKDVFLQTATTLVRKPGFPSRQQETRLIIDGGSDRSYISGQLVHSLQLKPLATEYLAIHKLRQNKRPGTIISPIVELDICLRNRKTLRIRANVLSPVVCKVPRSPLDLHKWGKFLPPLHELADVLPAQKDFCPIDLLIGGDYLEQILLAGRYPISSSGLYLRNSKLGYIISGACNSKVRETGNTRSFFCITESVQYSSERDIFPKSLPNLSEPGEQEKILETQVEISHPSEFELEHTFIVDSVQVDEIYSLNSIVSVGLGPNTTISVPSSPLTGESLVSVSDPPEVSTLPEIEVKEHLLREDCKVSICVAAAPCLSSGGETQSDQAVQNPVEEKYFCQEVTSRFSVSVRSRFDKRFSLPYQRQFSVYSTGRLVRESHLGPLCPSNLDPKFRQPLSVCVLYSAEYKLFQNQGLVRFSCVGTFNFAQGEGQPIAGKILCPSILSKNFSLVTWAIGLFLKFAEWLRKRRKVYFYSRTYCRIHFWLLFILAILF